MRTDLADKLANVDLFAGLSDKQRKRLAGAGKVIDHAPGKAVASEGESGLAFHLILDGEFDVSIMGRHVRTLSAGDFFGEISMIDGKPRSAAVTARSKATCLAIPHTAFLSAVESEPGVAQALLVSLAARLREAEAQSEPEDVEGHAMFGRGVREPHGAAADTGDDGSDEPDPQDGQRQS